MQIKIILLQILVLTVSINSAAQAPADQQAKDSKSKLSVSFDDELISGGTDLPAAEFIQNRINNRYKKMIKIRRDFIQDVENSKDDFKNK